MGLAGAGRPLLVMVLLGCGHVPTGRVPGAVDAAPRPACPRAAALDPAALRSEVECLLASYVRIDTTNPPGNELDGARFLAGVLARDGIEARIVESAPGRGNLYARLPGAATGEALALMHHMDVVPADPAEWTVPPFAGAARDGEVWGRGSVDDKGGGIVGLVTMLMVKRLGLPLPRDLVLLAVADEEAGGGLGARWLLEHRPDLLADVRYVLNEGGAILELGGDTPLYAVEVAQKAPLWLRVVARGRAGHGSTPRPDAATHALVRALARLAAHSFDLRVLPEVEAVFRARAVGMPPGARAPYVDLARSLRDGAFRERFLADARNAALVRNSLAITMLAGSDKENVVPGRASAVLDVRLLPGEDPAAVTAEIVDVMGEPSVEVETVLSWEAYSSSRETPLFAAIEALAARNDPGASVVGNVIVGFTDCNAFRAKGVTCYGFTPVRVGRAELGRVHGADERVSVEALARAVVDLTALVLMP